MRVSRGAESWPVRTHVLTQLLQAVHRLPKHSSWVPKTPYSTPRGHSLRPEELAAQWREVVPTPRIGAGMRGVG